MGNLTFWYVIPTIAPYKPEGWGKGWWGYTLIDALLVQMMYLVTHQQYITVHFVSGCVEPALLATV